MEPRLLVHEVRGKGDPVVLVPGGLTGWVSWVPHAEQLSERWMTVRVQPIHNELGSAGEGGDPGYSREIERESLRMTLDQLGVDRAHLAGWSGGGRALIEFALEHPDRARTLTLVEPAAHWVLRQTRELDADADRENELLHRLAGHDVSEDDLARFLVLGGMASSVEEARTHPQWERWVTHRQALSWQYPEMDESDRSVGDIARLPQPTLLVKGRDSAENMRRIVDALGERLPNARVLDLPGDHACHIQSMDAFLDAFEELATSKH